MRLLVDRRIVVWLCALIVATACSQAAPATAVPSAHTPLAGTTWRLVLVDGAVPPAGPPVTIAFETATVSGTGPCNLFGGGYVLDPDSGTLRIGDLVSTKRACVEPARGELETALYAALRTVDAASVGEDGRLVLVGPGGPLVWEP